MTHSVKLHRGSLEILVFSISIPHTTDNSLLAKKTKVAQASSAPHTNPSMHRSGTFVGKSCLRPSVMLRVVTWNIPGASWAKMQKGKNARIADFTVAFD